METEHPPPHILPKASAHDPKDRKEFQPRVRALLQVLMEMNGGAESSTG